MAPVPFTLLNESRPVYHEVRHQGSAQPEKGLLPSSVEKEELETTNTRTFKPVALPGATG
jgi:hypothetical protein